jgi:hypothetical protein
MRAPASVTPKSRNCHSLDMAWGLDGFQYGLHVIIDRTQLHTGDIPDTLDMFEDTIHEHSRVSTYGMISTNDHGVQTGITLLERLKMLKLELIHREVPSPVLLLSDNHSSRETIEVLEWLEDNSYSEGVVDLYLQYVPVVFALKYKEHYEIHIVTEPANSSGFLQALDQYNKKKEAAEGVKYEMRRAEVVQRAEAAKRADDAKKAYAAKKADAAEKAEAAKKAEAVKQVETMKRQKL